MEKLTKPSPTSVLRSSDARDYCCRGNSLGANYGGRAGSLTPEKSPAFLVVFENTDKTRTTRVRQEKGLPTGVSEALAA
jgi:hypothetical protein